MDWQRLDKFLWCARFASQREACSRLAEAGLVRINGLRTDKAHARVRVDDVLTVPLAAGVCVIRVRVLPERRGPASEAHTLYELLPAP
ncbi:MAG: S4 domain-containing protein [Rhodospirillales bacterium]